MKTKTTKENRKRLHSLILLTAFTAILLITSTYAWFTTQKEVSISNLRGKVEVSEGLQISLDAKTWVQEIDLADETTSLTEVISDDNGLKIGAYTGNKNQVPAEFVPVSTSGETEFATTGTPSASNMDELRMIRGTFMEGILSNIAEVTESIDDETQLSTAGYYAFDIFLKNSSKVGVDADILQLNHDSAAWVLPEDEPIMGTDENTTLDDYVGNPETGLQNTMRIAFAKYDGQTIPATSSQNYILEQTAAQKIQKVAIWEPNSDSHVQYILDTIRPLFLEKTGSDWPYLKSLKHADEKLATHALNTTAIDQTISPYNWTTSMTTAVNTLKTTSDDEEYGNIKEGVLNLKDLDNENLTLQPNAITKLRVYIYLEGQDPDCDNYASYGGGVEVKIGLTKGADEGYIPAAGEEEPEEEPESGE